VSRGYEKKLGDALDDALDTFDHDPAAGTEALRATSVGCRWMIASWKAIEQAITTLKCWNVQELVKALNLLGFRSNAGLDVSKLAVLMRMCYVAMKPTPDHAEADRVTGFDSSGLDDAARAQKYAEVLPTAEEAREHMLGLIRREIEWLQQVCDDVRNKVEKPALANRLAAAEIDSSADGMRLARYDAMNEMSFHRNWNALIRLRRVGMETLGVASESPAPPVAQNEPIGEPSSPEFTDTYDSSPESRRARAQAVLKYLTGEPKPAQEPPAPSEQPAAQHEPAPPADSEA
jgi:hypothetical protein